MKRRRRPDEDDNRRRLVSSALRILLYGRQRNHDSEEDDDAHDAVGRRNSGSSRTVWTRPRQDEKQHTAATVTLNNQYNHTTTATTSPSDITSPTSIWNTTPKVSNPSSSDGVIAAITVGALLSLCVVITIIHFYRRNPKRKWLKIWNQNAVCLKRAPLPVPRDEVVGRDDLLCNYYSSIDYATISGNYVYPNEAFRACGHGKSEGLVGLYVIYGGPAIYEEIQSTTYVKIQENTYNYSHSYSKDKVNV